MNLVVLFCLLLEIFLLNFDYRVSTLKYNGKKFQLILESFSEGAKFFSLSVSISQIFFFGRKKRLTILPVENTKLIYD